jgi:penicillin-binding protein 2
MSFSESDPTPNSRPLDSGPRRRRSWARRLVWSAIIIFFFGGVLAISVGAYFYERAARVDVRKLRYYSETSFFYDRNWQELGRVFEENRTVLTAKQIPDIMRRAVIAVEDRRFFDHGGIDYLGIARAMWVNVRRGRFAEGGSSLTQQLCKYLLQDFTRSLDRKLTEAFLAWRVERVYTKNQILDHYLNRVYFGVGYFGLEAAAQGYFGKTAADLSTGECALLAGIIRQPNSASPRNNMKKATERRNVALRVMLDERFITQSQYEEALKEPVQLVARQPFGVKSYAMARVMKDVFSVLKLGEDEIPQGLRVQTTLDVNAQQMLEAEAGRALVRVENKLARNGEGATTASGPLQIGALVVDSASGEILALVGGRDFRESQFDHASMARREIGAMAQPLVHALAVEQLKLHPGSLINSSFISDDDLVEPKNLVVGDPDKDLRSRFLTMQDCLALGNRFASVRAGVQMDPVKVEFLAQQLGADMTKTSGVQLLTGSAQLTLWEVAGFYQWLANQGGRRNLHIIKSVFNSRNEEMFRADATETSPAAVGRLTVRQMALTLAGAFRDGALALLNGEAEPPAAISGMVGFSAGHRDAWSAAFGRGVLAATWMGFDKSHPLGDRESAILSGLPVSVNMVRELTPPEERDRPFDIPPELTKVEFDRFSGDLKGLGGISPSANSINVFLRADQMALAQNHKARALPPGESGEDWSDWLTTLFAASLDRREGRSVLALLQNDTSGIPPVADFRMPPLRGKILAADGEELAATGMVQSLVVAWPPVEAAPTEDDALRWLQQACARFQAASGISIVLPEEKELRSFYRFQRFIPLTIVDSLTDAQVEAWQKSGFASQGFQIQPVPRRTYPNGGMAVHLVGTVQRAQRRTSGPITADAVIYEGYDGGTGIEKVFDKDLQGTAGKFSVKTNPAGFAQVARVETPATQGWSVRTTLDFRLQKIVEESMKGVESGAVVILNPVNGDVLAMASRPDFDPNSLFPSISPERWSELSAPTGPLLSRAFQLHFPPGSTFKVITALAAARAGVLDPARRYEATGILQLGNITYKFPKEKDTVNFRSAIARSFNSYFIDLGLRAGRDQLVAMAKDLGIGSPIGFPLPGELSGLMPDPAFVKKTHERVMGPGDVANSSIGQGDVLATPLQMASAFATIANGGILYRPRLVSRVEDTSGKVRREVPVEIVRQVALPTEMMPVILDGMVQVTEHGTGRKAAVPGISIAAKTGTAQVGSKQRPRQIAWLCGFLPAEAPRYAFAVAIEGSFDEEIAGGGTAGPIVGEIFRKMLLPEEAPTP